MKPSQGSSSCCYSLTNMAAADAAAAGPGRAPSRSRRSTSGPSRSHSSIFSSEQSLPREGSGPGAPRPSTRGAAEAEVRAGGRRSTGRAGRKFAAAAGRVGLSPAGSERGGRGPAAAKPPATNPAPRPVLPRAPHLTTTTIFPARPPPPSSRLPAAHPSALVTVPRAPSRAGWGEGVTLITLGRERSDGERAEPLAAPPLPPRLSSGEKAASATCPGLVLRHLLRLTPPPRAPPRRRVRPSASRPPACGRGPECARPPPSPHRARAP